MRLIWSTAVAGAALAASSLLLSNASAARAQEEQAWPEPSAQAVWGYLQQQEYEDNWSLWPGTGELYEGTQPHGMLLTTYVNRTAADALSGSVDEMPRGSIIVKENYKPTQELAAVTVMYKAPEGYDPDHNDWFWLKRLADGTVEVSGRATGCQSCHGISDNDYLRTPIPAS